MHSHWSVDVFKSESANMVVTFQIFKNYFIKAIVL